MIDISIQELILIIVSIIAGVIAPLLVFFARLMTAVAILKEKIKYLETEVSRIQRDHERGRMD